MTAVVEVLAPPALPRMRALPRVRALGRVLRLPREAVAVPVLALASYAALGLWLVLAHNVIVIDAISRVANASYVIDSRYPHLAAVGFVWNPLPSLLMLPFVALGGPFLHLGLASNVVSAALMAVAVRQLVLLLQDAGTPRVPRLLLVGCFALHPMLLFYGANGMSEASLLAALLWGSRRLAQWVRTGSTSALALTGLALGVAYTARYEAVAAGAGTAVVVAAVTLRRTSGDRRGARVRLDLVLALAPLVLSFVTWAALSWVVVGSPFETFTSLYGNASQVAFGADGIRTEVGLTVLDRIGYVGTQLLALAPGVLVLIGLALVVAVQGLRRVDPTRMAVLGPVGVLGAVLAFQELATVQGSTFGWLRFSLTGVPLSVALAGVLLGVRAQRLAAEPRPARRAVAACLAVTACAAALPTGAWAMADRSLAREEAGAVRAVFAPSLASDVDRALLLRFTTERRVVADLDALHLPDGSVLIDTAPGFGVLTATHRPKQFVVTSDLDFDAAVADPAAYDVRYLLTQPTPLDAINVAYPGVYENGLPWLRAVKDYPAPGVGLPWRLYEVVPAP